MYEKGKRFFDISLALLAGLVLLPFLFVISLVVKLTSEGPVIHWSRRVGKGNREFQMAKFRSMRIDTPQVATHLLSDSKQYLTPIGSFLRRSSLDELPQLINILRGDLSVVGPRPALYNQQDLIDYRTRDGVHEIMPGITGWAQVSGRDELPIEVKAKFDCYYAQNRSFWFDLKIIWLTFIKVARAEGVSH